MLVHSVGELLHPYYVFAYFRSRQVLKKKNIDFRPTQVGNVGAASGVVALQGTAKRLQRLDGPRQAITSPDSDLIASPPKTASPHTLSDTES